MTLYLEFQIIFTPPVDFVIFAILPLVRVLSSSLRNSLASICLVRLKTALPGSVNRGSVLDADSIISFVGVRGNCPGSPARWFMVFGIGFDDVLSFHGAIRLFYSNRELARILSKFRGYQDKITVVSLGLVSSNQNLRSL